MAAIRNGLFEPQVEIQNRPNGDRIFRSLQPLGEYQRCVTQWLVEWSERIPDRVFVAQRNNGDWRRVTYAEAMDSVRRLGQALLDKGLNKDRPLMILSGNGIDFALLSLAAMHVGIPVAPVSPAYSLSSGNYDRVAHIGKLVTPGLVYASNAGIFKGALKQFEGKAELAASIATDDLSTTSFDQLLATTATAQVDQAFAEIKEEDVGKILFTSGSTGMPKGVINTHRMMCTNQQAIRQFWTFLGEEPPVLVDWLPWHHVFGGNYCFNLVLKNGGTLYIDEGKPAPNLIEITVQNLREVSPTIYFNVPAGYQALLPYLEQDDALKKSFFRHLRVAFYAAAALPKDIWDRLEQLAESNAEDPVAFISAWGSTETAPLCTQTPDTTHHAGAIGIPIAGTELKLHPVDEKIEVLVRGPNVTPGYWRQPELTAKAFDEEGFYRIGDAVRFADPGDISQGLAFDGRIAEDFKLTTGTWVNAGNLRVAVLEACSPLLQDVVIAGSNRDEIGVLAILNPKGCATLSQSIRPDSSPDQIASDPAVLGAAELGGVGEQVQHHLHHLVAVRMQRPHPFGQRRIDG